MPKHIVSPGDTIKASVKGIVVYNAGGFIGITNSREVYQRSQNDDRTFDRNHGEYYFDIPEFMIPDDPEVIPAYPDGTLAWCTTNRGGRKLLEWMGLHWRDPNTKGQWTGDPIMEAKVVYNPEEPV